MSNIKRQVKELKRIARMNLQGNYVEMIRAFIFCNIIVTLVEMPFALMRDDVQFSTSNLIYYAAVLLIGIASVVLTAGQYRMHLKLARSGKAHLAELFFPFKYLSNQFILTELILYIINLICLIPLGAAAAIVLIYENSSLYGLAVVLFALSCILTLYVMLTFDLVYLVMNDNENLSMFAALRYTKNLVTTHRKRYFYLQLSFTGMILLVVLSMGLAMFWVQPYRTQTITLFYLDVTGELDKVLENRKKETTLKPEIVDMYV